MAVVWMGCHSLPGGVGAWGQNRGIKTARLSSLYLVPTVAVMAAFLGAPERIPELLRPEIVVAGAIVYGMMLMVAHRWTGSVKDGIPRRPPWLATVPGILTVVGVLFFRFLIPPATVFARPVNVLVVGIDTLRYDHTSLSPDPAHETTPHLAALAGRGTVFRTAISQAPWTMPAFASIMTGRYPREHGAVSLSGYLRPGEVTLAERLREAGYETKGIVSHIYVNAAHGFAQGFNAYDENNVLGHHEITSRNVTDRAIIFLKGIQGRPFFLFTHYFDPHYEYRDHESVHFADRYTGWLAGQQLDIGGLRDRRHELSREDLNYLRDLYDEEITYTDAEIGRLLDYLRTSGLEQKTIVVVVGDHGEEFMERGWLGHTTSLHREQIHVPLVIALPAGTQQVPTVSAPVETRAILPTVLDYLVSSDSAGLADGSLLPLMTGNSTASKEPAVFSEVWLPDAGIEKRVRMSGVRTRRWKFVRDLTRGEERLFDLDADPGERLNLMDEQPEQGAKLRALLDAWSDQMPGDSSQSTTRAMTREEVEMLRSLGYVK
ncbi:MAG: sulfatase [Acidobacteriota bacterium]